MCKSHWTRKSRAETDAHQRAHRETTIQHDTHRPEAEAPYHRHQRDGEHGCSIRDVSFSQFAIHTSTTVVDRRETELLPAFDSGMSWRGIDDVFASGTNAAGAQIGRASTRE